MQTLEYRRPVRSGRRSGPRARRFLCALTLALALLLSIAMYQTPRAHASSIGSTDPIIHWDQSMIYPGQNNGYPEGPVGETAVVHGQNFTAGLKLRLLIVSGNSNTDATVCKQTGIAVGTVTTSASGNFDASFAWPAQANQPNKTYSICSVDDTQSSSVTVESSTDDGPFTVLSASKPTFSLSATSAAAGSTITVTGQNWVPAQPLNITIASCADCDPGSNNIAGATTTSIGRNTGTFSVNVTIPAKMAPNNYVVNVASQTGPLDAYHIDGLGVKQLSITAAVVTPTPTTVPSPSVTANPTQTVATTPTTTASSATSSNGGNGNGALLIILVVLAIVLLVTGGVIFFVLAQRKKQATDASGSSTNGAAAPGAFGANQANPFNAVRTPVTPFPQNQPVSTPGQFGNVANNGGYSGYNAPWQGNAPQQPWQNNQPDQPWQGNLQNNWTGNPQSSPGFNNFQQNQPFQPQGNGMPGQGMSRPPMNRQCMRCGSPLAPHMSVCGVCGTRNPITDPNDPTVAY